MGLGIDPQSQAHHTRWRIAHILGTPEMASETIQAWLERHVDECVPGRVEPQ